MSDLISTPSQTQSPVSSEAFEALIDLLASDGIGESPPRLPADHTQPQATRSLRDASGKLDFDKIRLMFASQNKSHRVFTGQDKNRVHWQSLPVPHDDGDSEDDHQSLRSTSSTVPSCTHSMSPKLAECQSAGHRRSSTFGDQPWAAMHENAAKVEDVAPTLPNQPLSFDELNTALACAHEEVRSLRQRYDVLQALVAKRLGTELREKVKPLGPGAANGEKVAQNELVEMPDAGSQAQPSAIVPLAPPPPPSDLPTEIADLSGDEAKRVLCALARSLNLSLDAIGSVAGPSSALSLQQSLFPPNPARQHDVASINRALKFLGTVDELVWRRTSAPSGPRTLLPVFSEENIVALVARLELWERAVRRSSRT